MIIVGYGVQGKKRQGFLKEDFKAIVDPFYSEAHYKSVEEVPLDFDAALICTPDEPKYDVISYLLKNKKHVLVEKPLFLTSDQHKDIEKLSQHAVCYTAYNHRFEPHFVRMKEVINSNALGKIYSCRMFYGNGTAREVRNSAWRDSGQGVIHDLGSHLLDTVNFWFQDTSIKFERIATHNFENKASDHAVYHSLTKTPYIQLEMTLLSWRNHFTCDVFGEKGSAHIESLCKWGPSKFTLRDRKLPSGRPNEETLTLIQPDPTWDLEYDHFKRLCKVGHGTNIDNDIWIQGNL